jgi:hypothetical protein
MALHRLKVVTGKLLRGEYFQQGLDSAAERLARAANRPLYKPHVTWWHDRAWLAPFEAYLDDSKNLDRRFALVQWAQSVRRLRGSTAECGVYEGVGSALICKALEGSYPDCELHLGFDSFEGLSAPMARDACSAAKTSSYAARSVMRRPWKGGDLACTLEAARQRVAEFAFCRFIQGWIPDCFSGTGDRAFRFLHIDVDLFQPTLDSLVYFYPRLVAGGVVLLDDYGLLTCQGARGAVDEFFADKPESIVELPTGQAVVIKM